MTDNPNDGGRLQRDELVLNTATTGAFAAGVGDRMADILAEEQARPGSSGAFVYGRYWHPTVAAVEKRVANLEHPEGGWAVLVASGMSSNEVAMGVLTEAWGDVRKANARRRKALFPNQLYGGTLVWWRDVYQGLWGGEAVCVDIDSGDPTSLLVDGVLRERPGVVFLEIITNPTLRTLDLRQIIAAAKQVDAVVVVDNTLATCKLVRPLALGADLVVHSCTKFLGGHGSLTAGVVIGRNGERLPERCARRGTDGTLEAAVRNYVKLSGPILGPREAFEFASQLRTFHLRMEAQQRNAAALAAFLQGRREVQRVYYPGLADDPCHGVARELFGNRGYGAMVTVELYQAGSADRFIKALVGAGAANRLTLGDLDTGVLHVTRVFGAARFPGKTELVRISVGCEDTEDLQRRFDEALRQV
jgi:cystathionine beta-lyase/cystathionine gamma-synthase